MIRRLLLLAGAAMVLTAMSAAVYAGPVSYSTGQTLSGAYGVITDSPKNDASLSLSTMQLVKSVPLTQENVTIKRSDLGYNSKGVFNHGSGSGSGSGSGTGTGTGSASKNKPKPPTIPEPATLILLGTGLAGAVASRRKRRGNKQE